MDVEGVHMDSHAEDNEGGSKSERKISEKLEARNREWSNEIAWLEQRREQNARIQTSTIAVTVTGSV